MATHTADTEPTEADMNLVELWLRKDPIRWLAGAAAGLFAGLVALAFAMIIAGATGLDPLFPIKLIATIPAGSAATELAFSMPMIIIGLAFFELIGAFFGLAYAHFTATNHLASLLAMGLVWGLFSWIFIWNLFMPAFRVIVAAGVPAAGALPVCLAYGVALTSVAFFDRAMRKSA